MEVTGSGNFDAVRMPPQDAWTAFKTYPPTVEFHPLDPLGIRGRKTFEQVIIPDNADPTELPPLRFSYFDPETERYTVTPTPRIPLRLQPNDIKPAQPTVLADPTGQATPPEARQLRHIKTRPGTWLGSTTPFLLSPWFVGVQTVPLLAWFSVLVTRRRAERIQSNPLRRRKVLVEQVVRAGRKELRKHADQSNADAFFGTAFRLLQERLGERLNLPASSITESVIDDSLPSVSNDESLRASLHTMFQLCNHARYAPDQSRSELKDLIPKIDEVLGKLNKLRNPDVS